jgi:hypothetical protein
MAAPAAGEKSVSKQHFRQGDVLVLRVARLPKGTKAIQRQGRIVLAHGEVTGHAHAIADSETQEFSLEQAGVAVRRFLKVVSEAHVKHEEHATIALPAGLYEIVQQREYSPDAIRNVAD